MSRGKKAQQSKQEVKVEQKPQGKKVDLKRALSVWRKQNPQRAMYLQDAEAVGLFVKRYIPTLAATQEEFDEVFKKF